MLAAMATLACCALAGAAAGAPAATVAVELAPGTGPAAAGAGAEPAVPAGLVTRLERRLGHPLPGLRRVYRVEAGGPAEAERLARRLDARAGVEATVAPRPAPPPAICRAAPDAGWPSFGEGLVTPDLSGLQEYREGLGIPEGANGTGVRVADVEYDWRGTHEELAGRALPDPVDSPWVLPEFMAEDHGTAVLGIIAGDQDGEGITGLAHGAQVTAVSPFRADDPATYRLAEMIGHAARGLLPGDVLLIEQQLETRSGDLVPVEVDRSARVVIQDLVRAGIVVVEPAGNGQIDLASVGVRADPSHPDYSGALVVGAGGSAGTGNDLSRSVVSNYGARVDVQGYGEGVLTTGYGQELGPEDDPDRRYTACFDGTSSASATVAGAVAVLQEIAVAERGAPLTPAEVRRILVATGTPQAPPAEGPATPIGPRPQVAAAAEVIPPVEPTVPPANGDVVVPPPPPATPGTVAPPPVPTAAAPRPRPAGIATASKRLRPASRSLAARLDRRRGRLTIAVRGLAPRAVVRIGSRVKKARRGRIVLRRTRPGRILVRVSAPPRRGVAVRSTAYRVTIPRKGPSKVARVRR